jgi:hypothetical protein
MKIEFPDANVTPFFLKKEEQWTISRENIE